MEIKFSRHAKRRANLYNIPETAISSVLTNTNLHDGEQEIMINIPGFNYPLKIVVSVEGDTATVITSYPLKKGKIK